MIRKKIASKLGIKEDYLKLLKKMCRKPVANIIL